jgi:5-methylcytosine-specific restriction enzyme subunit McrC
MTSCTLFEFDSVVASGPGATGHTVPPQVFAWLESQCLADDDGAPSWLKVSQRGKLKAIRFANYVGVVRASCGFQIEILPKIGKKSSADEARARLLEMLQSLAEFRHIKIADAQLATVRMPLLEVFIKQFLGEVSTVVKRGLRSDYIVQEGNLPALRGKLLIGRHLSQNLVRPDRFYSSHDEFCQDRAENRLIHSALRSVLAICKTFENQRLARELCFVFADVPTSKDVKRDINRVQLGRGMGYYAAALEWAKLILAKLSPIVGTGAQQAQSLLFPMEIVFEAYVGKHLARQLQAIFTMDAQSSRHYLVGHREARWFKLKPDLVVRDRHTNRVVLDTKWKLLDATKDNARDKYQLSQGDFYQLYAYGHHYLDANGIIVLIYPKTDAFSLPLPVFNFPKSAGMRLWVLPFCLSTSKLILPDTGQLDIYFGNQAA